MATARSGDPRRLDQSCAGGGFVGIHSASDTEYHWPWYGWLVGTYFASHPQIQHARIHIEDLDHPSTKNLPATWERSNEWYNFRSNPRGAVQVLATLDETTYSGERAMRGRKPDPKSYKIAILWRGDAEARQAATPQNNRFYRIFEELAAIGIDAEPAVYDEEFANEVREQLLAADGVLVWVDPIHQGKSRAALDALLRDVASRGPWVRAHPDVILKMGVKEVLYRTKHLGWGSDTHLYRTTAEFDAAFPRRLQSSGPRVIEQNRGNGGQGVWKVEQIPTRAGAVDTVRVLHAQRGSIPQELPLHEFMARCEAYFAWGGCIIDQPFQPARANTSRRPSRQYSIGEEMQIAISPVVSDETRLLR
jgi:Trehalose utilisation